jgi:hypothetical protein
MHGEETMIRAKTRVEKLLLTVTTYRCVVCGAWRPVRGNRPRLTCSDSHRTRLLLMRRRGEVPRFAVVDDEGGKT